MKLRGAFFFAMVGGAVGWACIGSFTDSVRFNTQEPDFGLPPARVYVGYGWAEGPRRPLPGDMRSYGFVQSRWEAVERRRTARLARLRAMGREAEADLDAARFASAVNKLQVLVLHAPENRSRWRDRLEIAQAGQTRALPKLADYLKARRAYERRKGSEADLVALANDPAAGPLRAHAAYARAAMRWEEGPREVAGDLFLEVAGRFPHSPRAEAALIMAARSYLQEYDPAALTSGGNALAGPSLAPETVTKARRALHALRTRWPNSRFTPAALGWEGRIHYRNRDYPEALRWYLCEMNAARTDDARVRAMASVKFALARLDADGAKRFSGLLRSDSTLLDPYLEYRLFHTEPNSASLRALAAIARGARLSPRVDERLAEIALLRGRPAEAEAHARRALTSGSRPGALYTLASALQKRGKLATSRATYRTLIRAFPADFRIPAARENVALVSERMGDPSSTLDEYFALDYRRDVAWLVDVRMSPKAVEAYLQERPDHPQKALLAYSIGVRHLRAERYRDALRWLQSIPKTERIRLAGIDPKNAADYAWYADRNRDRLQDPIQTARDLQRLTQAAKGKRGRAWAKAQLALADYFYQRRNLLLYNPAVWEGSRAWNLMQPNPKVTTAEDQRAIRDHIYEHECVMRAKVLCQGVAKRVPGTPEAARALYRVATASRRLAEFNGWWRGEAGKVQWRDAVRAMEQVAKDYPSSPLAKAARKYAAVYREEAKDSDAPVW